MKIYDKSGHSPIHYAAYKNIDKVCEVLIKFVLSENEDEINAALPNVREKMRKQKEH